MVATRYQWNNYSTYTDQIIFKMYTSENNHYKWQYGSNIPFGLQTGALEFKTTYGQLTRIPGSFKYELERTASSTLDHYPGLRPTIFFSGGVDSELILRSYVNIGADPKVFIIRYESDINIYDVSYAVTICSILNLSYTIIDFNLGKFFENDAEQFADESQIDRPRMLPSLKYADFSDGLSIVGHSDMSWARPTNNYNIKEEWECHDYESDIGCDKYNRLHNRPAIYQWWRWSPELVYSFTQLDWFKRLTNDEYIGKLGINSTKIYGYREAFPDLISRKKHTGFEKVEPVILEFENFLIKKHKGLHFRHSHVRSLDNLYKEISSDVLPLF